MFRIITIIQKTDTIVLIYDSRSVFVVVVIKHLEGERDYGQQALATCTFLRSHFRRGVVHMILVHVEVQGVKSMSCFNQIYGKLFVRSPEAYVRTVNTSHILYFIIW